MTMTRRASTDPYWIAAAQALGSARAKAAAVLAPEGFASYFEGAREYGPEADLRRVADEKTAWLVVHKDHLDRLDAVGLAAFLVDSKVVFANEVFGVLALASPERRADPHVSSFIDRLRQRGSASHMAAPPTTRIGPVYLGNHTALTRTVFGHKFFVDTRDMSLAPHLLLDGAWEAEITSVLRGALRPGMVAVEVGTNCGFYSVLIADGVGYNGRFHGFEPNPRMCDLARRNLEINGFRQRAEVFNQAAAAKRGRAQFQLFEEHMGSSSLLDVSEGAAAFWHDRLNTIEVETISLDEALAELPAIDFVKMDAEGAEPMVIAGAQKLLARSPRLTMIVEFNPQTFPNKEAARGYLADYRALGFRLHRITPQAGIEQVSEEALLEAPFVELFLVRD